MAELGHTADIVTRRILDPLWPEFAAALDGYPDHPNVRIVRIPFGSDRFLPKEDYHNLARLAHALPNQDLSGYLLVEPGNMPARTAHLHMLYAHTVHSDEPFIGRAARKAGARHTMEMASILFGEEMGTGR